MGYYSKMLHMVQSYEHTNTKEKSALIKLMIWNAIHIIMGDYTSTRTRLGEMQRELNEMKNEANCIKNLCQKQIKNVANDFSWKKQMISLLDLNESSYEFGVKEIDLEEAHLQDIHIVLITDEGYALPTAVAITSIMNAADNPHKYFIHVLGSDLSDESKSALINSGNKVEIIDVDANLFSNIDFEHAHVSKTALFKFMLPEIFNDYEKILYIDGDVLIQKDLENLYCTDISSHYAAVVRDYHIMNSKYMFIVNRYGIADYFNSGVMLMNLKKMREDGISKKLMEKKKELILNSEFTFMDQDALNLVLNKKVKYMSVDFNFLNCYYSEISTTEMAKLTESNVFRISEIYRKPTVLHIGGGDKPWLFRYGERSVLYQKYLRLNEEYREKKNEHV